MRMSELLIAVMLAACSAASAPPSQSMPPPNEPPAPAAPLTATPTSEPATPTSAPALGDGQACTDNLQCGSGICEGQGCTDKEPGRCAPAKRGCTRDLRAYCGCDGATFQTSGSCPGRRFAHTGGC